MELLAVFVGAGAVLAGQGLSHVLTTRREGRSDFGRVLDRAVSAYAEGERALDDLTDALDRSERDGLLPRFAPYVEEALVQAERTRVEMRAALFSIRVRQRGRATLHESFDAAFTEWESGFLNCKVAIRDDEELWSATRTARDHADRFRGQFYDQTLDLAEQSVRA